MGMVDYECVKEECVKKNNGKAPKKKALEQFPPNCPKCAQAMTRPGVVVAVVQDPFTTLENKVNSACNSETNEHKYVRAVVAYLKSDAVKFKPDFIAEIKKEIDFKKFTKNEGEYVRSEADGDICFDNAMKNAGSELPTGCP